MTPELPDRQGQLDRLCDLVFTAKQPKAKSRTAKVFRSDGATASGLFDQEIIAYLESDRDLKASALWRGSLAYHDRDASRADMALIAKVYWLIGSCDQARADRLFRMSGLMRDKWDEKHSGDGRTYGQMTLEKQAAQQGADFYLPTPRSSPIYNSHAGGESGVNSETNGSQCDADPAIATTGYGIILAFFKQEYQPTFRRGQSWYSASQGRDVKQGEACNAAPHHLILKLAQASDAPRDQQGNVARHKLPQFFRTWAPVAYVDLLATLEFEDQTAEVVEPARNEFRGQVAAVLHTLVTLGRRQEQGKNCETMESERRSLLDWCCAFAKPGQWKKVRSYWCWCRTDGPNKPANVRVALRCDLFEQIHRGSGLTRLGRTKFARLCTLYGVGTPSRACGERVVEVSPEFLAELFSDVNGQFDGGDQTHAGARENERQRVQNGAST